MATERFIIEVEGRGIRKVQRDIARIGGASQATRKSLAFMRAGLVAVASTVVIARFVALLDTFQNIQNRLRIVTSGTLELARATSSLAQISNETRSSFEATAIIYQRAAEATRRLGIDTETTLQFIKSLNQAVVLSGSTAESAKQGLIQFSQGLSSGTLRGDELRSVLETLPVVADVIAEKMERALGVRVTRGTLRELAAEGKLVPRLIIEAFTEAADKLEERFGKTIPTISQTFEKLKTQVILFTGVFDETAGITDTIIGGLNSFSNTIDFLKRNISGLVTSLEILGRAFLAIFIGRVAENIRLRAVAFLELRAAIAAGNAVALNSISISIEKARTASVEATALARTNRVILQRRISELALVKTEQASLASKEARLVAELRLQKSLALSTGRVAMEANIERALTATRTALTAATTTATAAEAKLHIARSLVTTSTIVATAATGKLTLAMAAGTIAARVFAGAMTLLRKAFLFIGGIPGLIFIALGALLFFRNRINDVTEEVDKQAETFEELNTRLESSIGLSERLTSVVLKEADAFKEVNKQLIRNLELQRDRLATQLETQRIAINEAKRLQAAVGVGGTQLPGFDPALTLPSIAGELEIAAAQAKFSDTAEALDKLISRILKLKAQNDELTASQKTINEGFEEVASKEFIKRFNKALDAVRGLTDSLSPAADALSRFRKAQEVLSEAQELGIITEEQVIETKRRLGREIIGVGNDVVEFAEKQNLLQQAFAANSISAREFKEEIRKIKIELLDTSTKAVDGFVRGILRIKDAANDLATLAEDTVVGAFNSMEDALVDFFTTGEIGFKQLVDSIFRDITKLAVRDAITGPLTKALFPEKEGGQIGGLGGLIQKIFGGGAATKVEEAAAVETNQLLITATKMDEAANKQVQAANKEQAVVELFGVAVQDFVAGAGEFAFAARGGATFTPARDAAGNIISGGTLGGVGQTVTNTFEGAAGVIDEASAQGAVNVAVEADTISTMGGIVDEMGSVVQNFGASLVAAQGVPTNALIGSVITQGVQSIAGAFSSGGALDISKIFGGGGGALPGFGAVSGVTGGGLGLLEGIPLLGAQRGASFDVGGRGGVDSNLVAFRASRGEHVEVTPRGERGGRPISVHFNFPVGTDVNSFRRSEGQIGSRISRSIDRATRRNS